MDDRYGKGREIMSILSSHRLGAVQTSERGKPEESSHKAVSVLVKVVMRRISCAEFGARDAMRAVFNACLATTSTPSLPPASKTRAVRSSRSSTPSRAPSSASGTHETFR